MIILASKSASSPNHDQKHELGKESKAFQLVEKRMETWINYYLQWKHELLPNLDKCVDVVTIITYLRDTVWFIPIILIF